MHVLTMGGLVVLLMSAEAEADLPLLVCNVNMKITFYFLVAILWFTFASFAFAQLPPGVPVTFTEVEIIVSRVANFFIFIGVLLAVIAIIISGFMYLKAGDSTDRLTQAKKFFWNAIIGSLIILGVGVILSTVAGVVTRDFFFCRLRIPGTNICVLR